MADKRDLPLTAAVFYILSALADGEEHGYAIMQGTRELSDDSFRMGPATLYTTIRRLLEQALIAEIPGEGGADSRRRYYRLTKAQGPPGAASDTRGTARSAAFGCRTCACSPEEAARCSTWNSRGWSQWFGSDMADVFAAQLAEARGSVTASVRVWWHTYAELLTVALPRQEFAVPIALLLGTAIVHASLSWALENPLRLNSIYRIFVGIVCNK